MGVIAFDILITAASIRRLVMTDGAEASLHEIDAIRATYGDSVAHGVEQAILTLEMTMLLEGGEQ